MNQKAISLFLLAAMTFSVTPAYAGAPEAEKLSFSEPLADGAIRLVIGDQPLAETGVSLEGRTFVSLRTMSNMVNAMVEWDMEKKKITIEKKATDQDGEEITESTTMIIGEQQYYKNGSVFDLDVPLKIVGDTPMVPIGIVADILGGVVEWNEATRTVTILLTEADPAKKASTAEKKTDKTIVKTTPQTNLPEAVTEKVETDEMAKQDTSSEETAISHEESADDLASWGYALQDGIYIEDMIGEKGYGVNFHILDLAPGTRSAIEQQTFKLTITDKYNERVVYTHTFVYGELPVVLSNLVNLDVPSQYFNESQYSYKITVGGEQS